MPKKKAPPDRGQRLLTLEELAAELRALKVRPEWVLGQALAGERIARAVAPFDPVAALERDRLAIWSPSVIDALLVASMWAQNVARSIPDRKPYVKTIMRAASALAAASEEHERFSRVWGALRLKREHDLLADELGSSKLAWARLAKREKVSTRALEQRITRAKNESPELPWPRKKARRS